jgi:hypothetical protein
MMNESWYPSRRGFQKGQCRLVRALCTLLRRRLFEKGGAMRLGSCNNDHGGKVDAYSHRPARPVLALPAPADQNKARQEPAGSPSRSSTRRELCDHGPCLLALPSLRMRRTIFRQSAAAVIICLAARAAGGSCMEAGSFGAWSCRRNLGEERRRPRAASREPLGRLGKTARH